jgi:hypothetical protein
MSKKFISIYFSCCIICLILSACTGTDTIPRFWPISITFIADKHINNNVRLPVDIIAVKNSDGILDIGPEKWFGDPERDTLLREEIVKLAIGNEGKRKIDIKISSEIKHLIVFSDYTDLTERKGQQIVLDLDKWKWNFIIYLRENKMELHK